MGFHLGVLANFIETPHPNAIESYVPTRALQISMNICTGCVNVAPRRVAIPYGAPVRVISMGRIPINPQSAKYLATCKGIIPIVPSPARSSESVAKVDEVSIA